MSKAEAAHEFQMILLRNGALILNPEPGLIDSDSDRNVFNYDIT